VQNEANARQSLFASTITETAGENRVKETADTIPTPRTAMQGQRLEQMSQLAEIFAAIFETLPDGSEPAHSTMEKAA
jgi:hypothetical protein